MNKMLSFLLALGLALVPLAFAHNPPGLNPRCNAFENPHDYAANGENIAYDIAGVQGSHGRYIAWDGNACGASFDGDFEFGNGGGFFPGGPWAPTCGYADHHHSNVHVHDEVLPAGTGLHEAVLFAVGADPTPPVIASNPQGGTSCIDDGCVCPGDLDPDDWLKYCLHKCDLSPPADNTNPSFGQPGGKGGYEVWLYCHLTTDGEVKVVLTDKDGDGSPDNFDDKNGDGIPTENPPEVAFTPPTSGSVSCTSAGHIYFPDLR